MELDSIVVLNMVCMRRTHRSRLQSLLAEAVKLVEANNWNCSVRHVFREANFCADMLAELGHQSGTNGLCWTSCLLPLVYC